MTYILALYSKKAFKECKLPALNNSDYSITLRKDEFGLEKDMVLRLEVINGVWRIKSTYDYHIQYDNSIITELQFEDRQLFRIRIPGEDFISVIVKCEDDIFHDFTKFGFDLADEISIGRDQGNNICYDFLGLVSRYHASIIRKKGEAYFVNHSPNGSYINGIRIEGEKKLSFGDYINIVGLHIVFLGDRIAVDTFDGSVSVLEGSLQSTDKSEDRTELMEGDRKACHGKKIYHRAPRTVEHFSIEPIEIEGPPQKQKLKKQSLFHQIGPSLTMALPMILGCILMVYAYGGNDSGFMQGRQSLFMYSGLVMAVSSAIIGAFWAISNIRNQEKEERDSENLRIEKYSEYLKEKASAIRTRYNETIDTLKRIYPAPETCLGYNEVNNLLWNRNRTHEDFLVHRLGLGEDAFPTEIKVPQKRFAIEDDTLADKVDYIKSEFSVMYETPITLDLSSHNLVGIIGDKRKTREIASALSLQIAAGNCYTDVKMGFIYSGESSDDHQQWDFAKWFPHVWSEDKKIRFVASNSEQSSDVFYELLKIFRDRSEYNSDTRNSDIPKPYYVLFISNPKLLEGEPFAKYAANSDPTIGLTTIIIADTYEQLPNKCDYIIECSEQFSGGYGVNGNEEERKKIDFDAVDKEGLETFARKLSSLRVMEIEESGELPSSLSYFDMLGVKGPEELSVHEKWIKNKTYENIKGQIGEKAGGVPCYLDVHEKYHGPHGLVAGTTGSGKSETLQTYMLSLAINYSPDDISFFIIDYKGGGMANLFTGLPHLAGQISNLSGNQVRRAMISIKSENRRRQRIFFENGVNNINNYTKLVKSGEATVPVPHLFIIIDEFAELKREEPDFMRELISVAQVGRSLGVHLILATQKPSGTVDDNIWSNSRFKLCLRVQDRQDSMDMLHKPDAAFITQAGRCYLQVGNDEVYELFQSGYSGAPYDENNYMGKTDIVQLITLNGKVEMSGNLLKQYRQKLSEVKWIDELTFVYERARREAGKNSSVNLQISSMYKEFEKNAVDYQVNNYNTARLKDFIELYRELEFEERFNASMLIDEACRRNVKLPQRKERTELDSVKDHLAHVAEEYAYTKNHQLWLPELPEYLYLNDIPDLKPEENDVSLAAKIGLCDDPANQDQRPVYVDFIKDGNIAVVGSVVSGKSTLLQTLMYSLICNYDPDSVNLYALDFSNKMLSSFVGVPHVGGIMFEEDDEKISKFFNMMDSILEERKTILKGGNYKQFLKTGDVSMPAIVIVIDNYAGFKEKTEEKYEENVLRLSKEGINHGIFLAVSGGGIGMNDISSRVAENISTMLTLSLPDKFAYGDILHTLNIGILPETGIKGRGLITCDESVLEYHVALAVKADNDYERLNLIKGKCLELANGWSGRTARRIPVIPEKPNWKEFSALEEYKSALQSTSLPIGYNSDNAGVYGLSLSNIYCFGVYGARMTGKKNFLKVCLLSAIEKNAEVCVIDDNSASLSVASAIKSVEYCNSPEDIFGYFERLIPKIQERNALKNELIGKGVEDDALFERINAQFKPIFIIITDLYEFFKSVYETEYEMKGFLENILTKGRYHNIYFIGALSTDKQSSMSAYPAFNAFADHKTGIHFGGKTGENNLLDYDYMTFAAQSVAEKPGVGLLAGRRKKNDPWKIIIPQVKVNDVRDVGSEDK